ncbi:hypothetical protein [Caulobacter rhizosphaerae]|uniref:hypothetical protein n=1 Tax=Caulobacter rhizosphaerae TaxID=2010972 RepID=UPI0013D6D75E|nr:hypothetical protein [Caulobacter rhizosphaerae]
MISTTRFAEALSSQSGSALENRPLVQGVHNVVVPTVGMIVPNWLLVVPRSHTLNFAQQTSAARLESELMIRNLSHEVAGLDLETVVLEHGPAVVESAVGCGVDHAHLHVLLLQRGFADALWQRIETDLEAEPEATPLDALHREIDANSAYYLAWRNGSRLLEQPVKAEVSQRFRKLVAQAAGVADQWDYRIHRFDENVWQTVTASQHRRALAA